MLRRRVCITGIGIVSPLGNTREETWKRVLAGESGAAPITAFDARSWPTSFSCEVKNFDLNPKSYPIGMKTYLNRPAEFGVSAAYEAMIDSGVSAYVDPYEFGLCIGANVGAISPLELFRMIESDKCGDEEISATSSHQVIRNHPGTLSAVLSARWNCRGATATVQTACASSGQSIGMAFRMIQRGEARAVIAGGADSLAGELLLGGFCLIGALSRRNDDPKKASRPFDSERDGFVAGEGAAMLVLEDLDHARARGASIYAEVVGYGETASAYRITDLPPDGQGVVEAMNGALTESEVDPDMVDYINAHGTSTELNDRIEALAIQRVFGAQNVQPRVSSTKSTTGHLISAAGAIELAFCALSIRDQKIPPNANLEKADCSTNIRLVSQHSVDADVNITISNSVGFGGCNSSLLLRRWLEG
jgi:3-oxoacyl-[acyl-carrier-protein] synthase II